MQKITDKMIYGACLTIVILTLTVGLAALRDINDGRVYAAIVSNKAAR